jgi:hypothetical protein
LCEGLGETTFEGLMNDLSPDGLSILHELAFLPVKEAKAHLMTLKNKFSSHSIPKKLYQRRMLSRSSRPQMTPFQLGGTMWRG